MRFNKLFRKVFAAVSAVTLIVSGMPVGWRYGKGRGYTDTKNNVFVFSEFK